MVNFHNVLYLLLGSQHSDMPQLSGITNEHCPREKKKHKTVSLTLLQLEKPSK